MDVLNGDMNELWMVLCCAVLCVVFLLFSTTCLFIGFGQESDVGSIDG